MRTRRQPSFAPSLVASAFINLAIFAVLTPIASTAKAPRRLTRLTQIKVTQTVALPQPVSAPLKVETPKPKPVATTTVGPQTRPAATAAPAKGVSSAWRPETHQPGAKAAPTGGDGTATVPMTRLAGGGDPAGLRAHETGTPKGNVFTPALGGLGEFKFQMPGRVDPVRAPAAGPATISPTAGAYGGTGMAPTKGTTPIPGVAGSGNDTMGLAPRTFEGPKVAWTPTTPGPRLRNPGAGLPALDLDLPGVKAEVVPGGLSGGGGGTAKTPGEGGGGLPPSPDDKSRASGGGGSGSWKAGDHPGGQKVGPGPGGTGGGGDGTAVVGDARLAGSLKTASSGGGPSVVHQEGYGEPGPAVRPGKRAPGPGGEPVDVDPTAAGSPNSDPHHGDGTKPAGNGKGNGPGTDGAATAVGHRRGQGVEGYTGVVIDTLGCEWHHYPGSYELVVGDKVVASVGVIHYLSVASARSSKRVERDGERNVLVVKARDIKFSAEEGKGTHQRVVISADDWSKIKDSGLLGQKRVLTVWKGNTNAQD